MKVFTCDQRSPEWHQARVGMFTASRASDMMATIKTGEAAARRDLRVQLVVERLTSQSQDDVFVNAAMQRGIDKEADALSAYEALTGNLTRSYGFLAHDTLRTGCSPDGIIGDFEGGLELKCPKSATHLGYLKSKTIPRDYLFQMMHGLWITGAQWWDFVSFDDRFPVPLQVFHVRLERDDQQINDYAQLATAFLTEIDKEVEAVEALAVVAA
jgi:hypothetical protein